MKQQIIKIILILMWLNCCYANTNKYLPKHKAVPGGVAILPLEVKCFETPVVFFNGNRVLVTKYHDDNEKTLIWVAVVGIPVTIKPGIQKISVHAEELKQNKFKINFEKSFLVSAIKYNQETLKIDPRLVTPASTQEQIRAAKEIAAIKTAYRHWSGQIPNLKMLKPIENSKKSSGFGLKRVINGKNKGYHSGLDLAAPIGTPIYAPSSGQVILTGNFFYSGNTIFIDHGQGLISSYFHLNSVNLNEGDLVDTRTIIGTVGATGRVTGPHLHWSISLNDARVNPELFLN